MEFFHFKGFLPSESLKAKADRALDRIVERAPSDARITASLEKEGELYHCHVEVGSASCPFAVETSHKFPAIAIDKAELNLMRRLDRWRGVRFVPLETPPLKPVLLKTAGEA